MMNTVITVNTVYREKSKCSSSVVLCDGGVLSFSGEMNGRLGMGSAFNLC